MTNPCMSCGEDRQQAAPERCLQPAAHRESPHAAFDVLMKVWIDRSASGVQATPGEHVEAFVRALRNANLIS